MKNPFLFNKYYIHISSLTTRYFFSFISFRDAFFRDREECKWPRLSKCRYPQADLHICADLHTCAVCVFVCLFYVRTLPIARKKNCNVQGRAANAPKATTTTARTAGATKITNNRSFRR